VVQGNRRRLFNLAVAAEQAGDGPVVISDTDPQGSTVDWFQSTQEASIEAPRYAPLSFADLPQYLRALQDAGASYLFIDTAPSIGGVNPDLFAIADLILIPLEPDTDRSAGFGEGLPVIKQSGKPFTFMPLKGAAEPT